MDVFSKKKLQELPSRWGLRPQAPKHVTIFKMSKTFKMALKWLFFKKNCKNCSAAGGWLPGPIVVIYVLSHTIFTTNNFQNVYTRFLNKQMYQNPTITAKPCLTIIPYIFINGWNKLIKIGSGCFLKNWNSLFRNFWVHPLPLVLCTHFLRYRSQLECNCLW